MENISWWLEIYVTGLRYGNITTLYLNIRTSSIMKLRAHLIFD